MHNISINCDLGECLTPSIDAQLMPLIDIANIACGGHAGDDKSMLKCINLAQQHQVKIGAHPSYIDIENFGRVSHHLSADELCKMLTNQLQHFAELCHQSGAKLQYIKPHGALYHDMMADKSIFLLLCKIIKNIDSELFLLVPAQTNQHWFALIKNQSFVYEMFADRRYENGKMISRNKQNAVLNDPDDIIKQYQQFCNNTNLKIDSICFHGDNQASVEALKLLNV